MRIHESPLYSYANDHEVRNVNEVHEAALTPGQRLADLISQAVGSWRFILIQSCLLVLWIIYNVLTAKPFDPFPFILLNLMLSFQAAYTGPVVMMSQNRQAEKDRLIAHSDYEVNLTADHEIRLMMDHLKLQDDLMGELLLEIRELRSALAEKP